MVCCAGGEGIEFGRIFDDFEAVVQLDVLTDFGEENGDFRHQFVVYGTQLGRIDHGVEMGNHAPNAADAFGNVGQFSTVLAQSVCVCALMAAICSRASATGGLQGRFDVFGFDLVETGFFAQVEQDVVAHMVSPE